MWPVDQLVPYARNSKKHSDAQVEQIAASIIEFGFTVPVLAGEDGTIIAGHGRVLAAKSLGIEEIPVMVARGWTEAQRRAYTIADNKLAENGEWDEELLALELGELRDDGFDIGLVGFDTKALGRLLEFAGNEGNGDPEATPTPPVVPVSRAGDVWVLGNHRIICGDSTSADTIVAVLAGEKPHLMVTDPPYGVEYDPEWRERAGVNTATAAKGKVLNDDKADWRDAWALFPGNVAYVWHAGLNAGIVADSLIATGFVLRSQIVWDKGQLVLSRGDYHWQHEPCWYAIRKGATGHWAGDRKQTTVWDIPKPQKSDTGHGTQKPVECMRRPIENNSEPGDAVYEPFSGSGTTIIACEQSGRRAFAIELNPSYVDVAVRRWQGFTGEAAVLEGDGRSFNEVAGERVLAVA
jgi:DNA modification methylase